MSEHIIENLSDVEIDKLVASNTDIEWYPDDLTGSDVCVYGTENDVKAVMHIIGRS